jgi:hypothetical protein
MFVAKTITPKKKSKRGTFFPRETAPGGIAKIQAGRYVPEFLPK